MKIKLFETKVLSEQDKIVIKALNNIDISFHI